MNTSKTTWAGILCAAGTLIQAIPGLPHWCYGMGSLLAGLSVGALGWHATTCPPGCPGTDALGNPRARWPAPPRSLAPLLLLGLMASLTLVLLLGAGCAYTAARVQRVTQSAGVTNTETTTLRGYSIFDANVALQKGIARASYGSNGVCASAVGFSGLNESATSSNLVVIINNVLPAAAAAAKPAP